MKLKHAFFAAALFVGLSVSADGQQTTTNINTGDVSVGTAATLIVAQRITIGAPRISVTVVNPAQAVSLCVGNIGVTAANGLCLAAVAGASVTLNTTAAIYGIWADGGTHSVSFVEAY
jgi:hypothetical protein